MTEVAWIALGGFILTMGSTLVLTTLGIKRFSETVQAAMSDKVDKLEDRMVQMELAYERKLSQNDAGIRGLIRDIEFYVRDNYVKEATFTQMIEITQENNSTQFKSVQTQLDRIFDKLDSFSR